MVKLVITSDFESGILGSSPSKTFIGPIAQLVRAFGC